MEVGEAQRLRSLEDANRRLKQLVADLSLDKEALKDRTKKCMVRRLRGMNITAHDQRSSMSGAHAAPRISTLRPLIVNRR